MYPQPNHALPNKPQWVNLHKVLNPLNEINFELVTVLEQTVCGRRQLRFELIRNFNGKIGMNTTANKFYHITNMISLDMLNLSYVHFKKIAKIQFLKYGKTWLPVQMCEICAVAIRIIQNKYVSGD